LVVNAKYIGGPGDVAGVELGDIVVGVAGKRVRMFEDVRKILLEQARLGESLPFHIVRPASSFDSPSRPARDPSARDVLIQVLTTDPDLRNQPRVFFDIECADRISRDGSVVKATKINSTVAPPQKH
jgi:membrane-associated protease RseP (regulator of RpoE activity)